MPVLSTLTRWDKQPHSGESAPLSGGIRPGVLLNFGEGLRPLNRGDDPSSETWTAIGTGTALDAVPTDAGFALRDLAQAGGVAYGAQLEYGRPVFGDPVWLLLQFTHAPYFNAGSSVNTIGGYGSGGSGLDGGALVHLTTSNQIRAWLMSVDVTTTWSAVEGQTYTVLVCRDASRNGHVWIDGVRIGSGTCSTAQFPGNSRLCVLSDDGLNERRARAGVSLVAFGIGDVTAEAQTLSLQPWRLLEQTRRVPVGAGGAPATLTATLSLSAAVQQAQTAVASISAAVQAPATASASIAAAVQQAQTATASLNAAVQQARSATAALDVAVQTSATSSASIDAALQLARTATSVLDLAVQVARTQTASIDAQIQAPASVAASISAQVQAGSSVSLSLGAAVLAQAAATAGVDLAVQTSRSATLGASAALQQALTAATAVDLAVQLARSAGVGINAQIQDVSSAAASIDAAVRFAALATSTVSAAVSQAATAQLVMGAAVSLQQSLQAAMAAAVLGARTASGLFSAYIDDGTAPATAPNSAPPLGHGLPGARRTPTPMRRRAANLSSRTR